MTAAARLDVVGRAAMILALYVLFSPLILLGVVAHLAYEFTLVGWESVERVL